MKINYFKSSTGLFTLAFSLLFVTNIIILSGAYINQHSQTTSQLTLTYRELIEPYYMTKESSNLSLRIQYRTLSDSKHDYSNYRYNYKWLNESKLQELGFDTKKYKNIKSYDNSRSKEVFVVLEYDGQTYQKSIQNSQNRLTQEKTLLLEDPKNKRTIEAHKRAQENLQKEINTNSRLFAIDTGLSYEVLRAKYDDKHQFLITKAIVKIATYSQEGEIYGYLNKLSVENVYVPYGFKKELNKSLSTSKIELSYGSRFEPYVSDIKAIK